MERMHIVGLLSLASASHYSTNMLCRQNHCVNPIFPALKVTGRDLLAQQEEKSYACAVKQDPRADKYLSFCAGAVHYDFALSFDGGGKTMKQAVKEAEDEALKHYFQHLSGLKYDAFDFRTPQDDPCVESIWKMACYAYFPKCNNIDETAYLRPCASTCQKYVAACHVECCDESVTCVFQKEIEIADGSTKLEQGFVDQQGPSTFCTGAAARLGALLVLLGLSDTHAHGAAHLGLLALAVSAALQGCDSGASTPQVEIPQHTVGNWRRQPDFSLTDAFVTPQGKTIYDSCSDPSLDSLTVCSGRGKCVAWNEDDMDDPLAFCQCHAPSTPSMYDVVMHLTGTSDRASWPGYAGPECRQKRRSQMVAFWLAVFFGPLGLDEFYIGHGSLGLAKLMTLGGGGAWWLFDIVHKGIAPVYTAEFKVSQDLPFWGFVLITVSGSLLVGMCIFLRMLSRHVRRKRRDDSTPSHAQYLARVLAATRVSSKPNPHLDRLAEKGLLTAGPALTADSVDQLEMKRQAKIQQDTFVMASAVLAGTVLCTGIFLLVARGAAGSSGFNSTMTALLSVLGLGAVVGFSLVDYSRRAPGETQQFPHIAQLSAS